MTHETYGYITRLKQLQEEDTVAEDEFYKAIEVAIKALSAQDQATSEHHDNVNSPAHYSGSCSMECIDVMNAVFGDETVAAFCLCNAFKYLWRFKAKNGEEDVKKAEWYLNRFGKLNKESNSFMPSLIDKADWLNKELEKAKKNFDTEGKV